MLHVELYGQAASWNDDTQRWDSAVPDIAQCLNDTLPVEEIAAYDAPFLIGGVQGIALRAARKVFRLDLRVTKRTPAPPPPPEEPGVDYDSSI